MINIKLLQDYLAKVQADTPGVINNIFLANNESTPYLVQIIFLYPLGNAMQSRVCYPLSSTIVSI